MGIVTDLNSSSRESQRSWQPMQMGVTRVVAKITHSPVTRSWMPYEILNAESSDNRDECQSRKDQNLPSLQPEGRATQTNKSEVQKLTVEQILMGRFTSMEEGSPSHMWILDCLVYSPFNSSGSL